MNRGYFRISKELMEDRYWPEIESELKRVFTEVERIERANGIFEVHGYSDHFIHTPIEGSSIEYSAIFTTKDNKAEFVRFDSYYNALKESGV